MTYIKLNGTPTNRKEIDISKVRLDYIVFSAFALQLNGNKAAGNTYKYERYVQLGTLQQFFI